MTNGKFIGVFNLTSEYLLLVDTTRNILNIFPNISLQLLNGSLDIMRLFTLQSNLLLNNSLNMVARFAFQVDGFLKSLRERSLTGFFHGNLTVFNVFNVNFGFYMNSSVSMDGFNTFMQPIVGIGKFSTQIVNNIGASIEYGSKLTIGTVSYIFVGLGRITIDINNSIRAAIRHSINSSISIGSSLIGGAVRLPGSLFNIIRGTIHIEGGAGFHISTGSNRHNGFLINFGNETGNYSINYNATHNTLGFYNGNLKLVLIADGNNGMFMILNETSSTGLIVNSTGYGRLLVDIEVDSDADGDNLDIVSRFGIYAKLLKENEEINVSDDMTFDFKAYLTAYLQGNDYFENEDNAELQVELEENFGDLFAFIRDNNGAELFAKVGISIMFNAVYGDNVIGLNFAQLMNTIYAIDAKNRGEFSVKLMKEVYARVQSNIKAGSKGFTKYIFSGLLKGCIKGSFQFNGLSGSVGLSGKC